MSLTLYIGIGIIGGIGAIARFLLDEAVSLRIPSEFPIGILVVNGLGAFFIGLLSSLSIQGDLDLLLTLGALGAFSTFSTWMLDTLRVGEAGHRRVAVLNILVSLTVGMSAVWLGQSLGNLF